jgi:hypothetical protein
LVQDGEAMSSKPDNQFLETHLDRRSRYSHRFLTVKKIVLIDFLLLSVAFLICHYLKHNNFRPDVAYTKLLLLFYMCWAFSGMMGNKFRVSSFQAFGPGVWTCFWSTVYLTYLISFLVVVLGLAGFSRLHIFGTCLLLFGLEVTAWSVFNKVFNRRATDRVSLENILGPLKVVKNISYSLMFMDFCLAVLAFFSVNYLKRGDLAMLPDYPKLFLIFLGLWFFTSFLTGKFAVRRYQSVYFFLWQWFKAGFVMMAAMSVLIFGARLFYYSRLQALGPILVLVGLEFILVHIYFRYVINGKHGEPTDVERVDKVREILKQDPIPMALNPDIIREKLMSPAREKIKNRLSDFPHEEFEFIDTHIDLDDMMQVETAVERTSDLFNLDTDRVMLRLYLNMKKINDIRRLNVYFLQVHQILLPGGYFTGFAHTIKTRHAWIYERYPRYIAHLVYGVDFSFHRIMPKLPGLQKLYFQLTQGRGRVISRAELLGRLCFCGYDIVAEKEIGRRLFFIARKAKTASLDKNPTYGPLVQLKRSGLGGKTVFTYKFRTMHPYSEYLQQYVFERQGLEKGGKLENDFRMTTWGKFMRKLWLDELPMLYNWLKGDLGIVGVRPLSFQYLSLYDKDLQELRKKVRPGLVPPYYADLPETFEQICESERRYINAFLARPIQTQVTYFCKAFVNIVMRGARSK